jgi:IS5 family transposase
MEPVIGHPKAEHRIGRNHLKGREDDSINAILAAVGYNFSLLLLWLAAFLCALVLMFISNRTASQTAYPELADHSSRTAISRHLVLASCGRLFPGNAEIVWG